MDRNSWIVLCAAYILGLLSTGVFYFADNNGSWQQKIALIIGLGLFSIMTALIAPRLWRTGPKSKVWLGAAIVVILAIVYFQIRIPQPGTNDISHILTANHHRSQIITIEGRILSPPKLTRTQRLKFWFEARQVKEKGITGTHNVTGKLYVTIPQLKGADLFPGEELTIVGVLYQPKLVSNPGSFDFKSYLNRQGAFAALKGFRVKQELEKKETTWSLWKLRQRIVAAQILFLNSPVGQLVSAMVLGRQAVDLPYGVQDLFIKAGLAHILAASGFQVAVLLGIVIALTKRFSRRIRLSIGLIVLGVYIGLTGAEPSILRAGLMGVGALFALVTDRTIRPLGSLLLAAILLLLLNPLWIWDLSFQLSFLATLGLMVTVPALSQRLDWLPPAIATLIAIPIAAAVWTLPLILNVFHVVALYSIPANILTAPLISTISLVGIASAVAALIFPPLGSAIAWLLYYPTFCLIAIVDFFTKLPGNSWAIGQIPLGLLVLIYALMVLVWRSQFWQRRWWVVGLFIVMLIVVPIGYSRLTLTQVTVLATQREPITIIQDRGKVILINSGEADIAKYVVLPFLMQQGINQIDYAVAFEKNFSRSTGWLEIQKNLPIKQFLSTLENPPQNARTLSVHKTVLIGSVEIQCIEVNSPVLQLRIQDRLWWLLPQVNLEDSKIIFESLQRQASHLTPSVFLWSGKSLGKEWWDRLNPKVAIATAASVPEDTQQQLQQKKIKLYLTGRDGAIQWTPAGGFEQFAETIDNNGAWLI
jgi:competence protein ComEC